MQPRTPGYHRGGRGVVLHTHVEDVAVEDDKVEGHGKGHGCHQPDVGPGGHHQEGLVFGQAAGEEAHVSTARRRRAADPPTLHRVSAALSYGPRCQRSE